MSCGQNGRLAVAGFKSPYAPSSNVGCHCARRSGERSDPRGLSDGPVPPRVTAVPGSQSPHRHGARVNASWCNLDAFEVWKSTHAVTVTSAGTIAKMDVEGRRGTGVLPSHAGQGKCKRRQTALLRFSTAPSLEPAHPTTSYFTLSASYLFTRQPRPLSSTRPPITIAQIFHL
jgi:hypothetical protein